MATVVSYLGGGALQKALLYCLAGHGAPQLSVQPELATSAARQPCSGLVATSVAEGKGSS